MIQNKFFLNIRKKLICVIFILISFFSKAQTVFNKIYEVFGDSDFGTNLLVENETYFLIGWSQYSSEYENQFFLKIDKIGDELLKNGYFLAPKNGGISTYTILQSIDSSIIIGGWVRDDSEGGSDTYLMKLSKKGDSLWYKIIEGGFNDGPKDVKHTSDGGFAIVGYYYTDTLFNSTIISLIKTDSLGNIEWQKTYGQYGKYNFSNSLQITSEGGYIIGGEKVDTVCQCYKIYVIKTDSAGNLEWEKTFGSLGGQRWGYAIQTPDSGYLVSGRKRYTDDDYAGYLIRTDKNGNTLWEKFYQRGVWFDGFKKIISALDNNYVLIGATQNLDSINTVNNAGWLMKIDPQGNEIWSRAIAYTFGTYANFDTNSYFEDVVPTDDNGFAICGWVINPVENGNNDAWLVKTDCYGFVENAYPVTADFVFNQNEYQVNFLNHSDSACWYKWSFGDGDSSLEKNPAHTYADTGMYVVTLVSYNADKTDTLQKKVLIKVTDLNELKQVDKIIIYPNPMSDKISLNLNFSKGYDYEFQLFNLVGQRCFKIQVKDNTIIDLSSVSGTGLYFYKIIENDRVFHKGKIIINK